MAERRWYRLHLVTWLFVVIVGAALVWSQFDKHKAGGVGFSSDGDVVPSEKWAYGVGYFGWPFASVFQTDTEWTIPPRPPTIEREWLPGAILLNSLLCVLVIGSTALVLEKWSRSAKRTQFTIINLLVLIAVAAIWLMIINQRGAIYEYFGERGLMPSEVLEEGRIAASVACIPVLFALGCTIYTVGWLAFRLAACSVSALRALIARCSKD